MELYLDSADLDEIKEAFKLGFIKGLTTTPTEICALLRFPTREKSLNFLLMKRRVIIWVCLLKSSYHCFFISGLSLFIPIQRVAIILKPRKESLKWTNWNFLYFLDFAYLNLAVSFSGRILVMS